MPSALSLRTDYSPAELRRLAKKTKDNNQSRRLLSLAAVLDGMNRTDAARIGGMDRQTLRDWVHRFNNQGPDGLCDVHAGGFEPRLSPGHEMPVPAGCTLQALMSSTSNRSGYRPKCRLNCDTALMSDRCFAAERLRIVISSIMRRRRGLILAIWKLLSEGWAPTPTSSQTKGSSSERADPPR